MSDENNPQNDGMESVDDVLPMQHHIDDLPADEPAPSLADATVQAAARPVNDEIDVGSEIASDVDLAAMWDALDKPNEHVTVDNQIGMRYKADPTRPYLASLKVGFDELEKIIEARGLLNLSEDKVKNLSQTDARLHNLYKSLTPMIQEVYFDNADTKGDWHQSVLHNETKLNAARIKPENMIDPVLAIRATFGQGTVVQVPLWNTGLWASFRAPTVQELADFAQRTRLEKMNLGRSSNGMVFSNIEVYTVETYARFALEHIVSINYQYETADHVEELMNVILNRDYQQVIWGMVMAMYPDGYPFRQPCVADPDKCDHVDEVILNFARMAFVDRSKITDKQARMMASRKVVRNREWLKEYQQDFEFFEKRIEVQDGLVAILRVPTLGEQITAGHMWVDGIAKATNEAFGARLSEIERIRHILRSGELTNLRQHSHWIASFEHTTNPEVAPRIIEEFEQKDRLLEMLSEMPDVSYKLSVAIVEWIRETTVSYVAMPKYKCPSCQGESIDNSHPHLIPIDVGYVFFTLAALKISQVGDAAG